MFRFSSVKKSVLSAGVAAACSVSLLASDVFPPLPEAVTSFGAVTHQGCLYVLGGHKGERHEYSDEMVSGSFNRLRLDAEKKWEPLPGGPPAQGLALVAHADFLYRIGGMAAQNQAEAKRDLHSLALVQRFDIKRGQWEDFASLPSPRSSHDVVVVGNKIYVAGGWHLSGSVRKPAWSTNALVLDLSDPNARWQPFLQPFQRRGLALASLGKQIFCIGGMDSDDEPTLAVEIYDTITRQWSKGPDLPNGKYKGFSCSAIAQNGRIYVTPFQGDLLRLAQDGRSWEIVGRLDHPRIAHRLVTFGNTQLIALGGEDGEVKRPELEVLNPVLKTSSLSLPTERAVTKDF